MPKRSNEFQKLIFHIKKHLSQSAEVTESEFLEDRLTHTPREVDVCIQSILAGHKLVLCIECRDHDRPADVTWIEQMKTKHDYLPTNALVLVSRSGFTTTALEKAKALGIETLAFDDIDDASALDLLSDTSLLWAKSISLAPTKVVVRVTAAESLEAENVAVDPTNDVYLSTGELAGSVGDLVTSFLHSPAVRDAMLQQANVEHDRFEIRWEQPKGRGDKTLCLKKIEPSVLRPIEYVEIKGTCEVTRSEFRLKRGTLGAVQVVWGEAQFLGNDTMVVATQDRAGGKRISLESKSISVLRDLRE